MKKMLLACLCMAASLCMAADTVWITIRTEAVPGIQAHLSDSGNLLVEVDTNNEITVLEVDTDLLPTISEFMHHRFNVCGGFRYHENREEALAEFDFGPPPAKFAPSYVIDNGTVVNTVIGSVTEQPIIDTITQLSSYYTRYYTTQTGVDAANWLKSHWESIAGSRSDITVEHFTHSWAQPSVIVTIEGSVIPDEVIVLGAHLDSINGGASGRAPGADDDASGVATITEVLRALVAEDFVPDRTVKMMAYAAEEVGLRGSEAIANNYAANSINVIGAINFDMTNYKGSVDDMWLIQDNTNAAQNTFVENLIDTYLPGVTRNTTSCGYACSDHASWHQAGFAATMPSEAKFGEHNQNLHTSNDTISVSNNEAKHAIKFARLGVAYVGELAKGSLGICTPQAVADAGPGGTVCLGNSITLGTAAQPNTTYSWSPGGQTTAQITVSPSTTTTYTVTATTTCGSRDDSATVIVDDGTGAGLSDDFEGDISGWSTSGLWHLTTNSSCASPGYASATHAFYYGQDSSCDYNTGSGTQGSLTSPEINGIDASSTLNFDYYRVVESYSGTYDTCVVDIVGDTTTTVWSRSSADTSTAAWQNSGDISLAAYAGQTIRVRFTFDSIDGVSNAFTGWFVDDVVVTGTSNCGGSNTAPTVSITTPADGTTITQGASLTFSGTANDAEDGNISGSISWSSNLDGSLGSGASVSATLSTGNHTITASVTDSGSLSASDTISVTVNAPANTAPTVSITAPADGTTITQGASLTFSGTANDTEDGNLSGSITWSSNIDGSLGSGASVNATLSAGNHTITASVTDSGSLSASDTISVTVNAPANNAPTVSITAPADGTSVTDGTSITFTGTASDVEDGNLSGSIAWSSNIDGALGSGASVSATLSVGTHTITASVTDSGSLSGSDSITVTVTPPANNTPTVNITAPADGTSVTDGTSITFTGTANDAEDGNISGSISWSSSLDGALGSGASVSATLSVGSHTITASVTDSGGLSASDTINVTVTGTSSWTTIDSNDFEAGWGIWNDGGTDVRRSANDSGFAHQGTYCVRLRDNTGAASSMFTDNMALAAYSEVAIDFWLYSVSMETGEDFYVEVSTDGGSNWTVVGNYVVNTDFANNAFTEFNLEVNSISLNNTTQVRIRCDASGNGDRIYIDEAVIRAR